MFWKPGYECKVKVQQVSSMKNLKTMLDFASQHKIKLNIMYSTQCPPHNVISTTPISQRPQNIFGNTMSSTHGHKHNVLSSRSRNLTALHI